MINHAHRHGEHALLRLRSYKACSTESQNWDQDSQLLVVDVML